MSGDEVFQSGEKELKKAFETVTTRNLVAVLEYTKETRKGLREVEGSIKLLLAEIHALKAQNEQYKIQLAHLQTKVFSGGTV